MDAWAGRVEVTGPLISTSTWQREHFHKEDKTIMFTFRVGTFLDTLGIQISAGIFI